MTTTMTEQAPREVAKRSIVLAMAMRYGMEAAAFEATVRATCGCAGATREEFAAFLLVAHEYRLNPITREIYAFPKKGGGIQPIVSIDGWLRIANDHAAFDGLVVDFAHSPDGGQVISATATIYRKDRAHPTVVTEFLAECVRPTEPWKMQHRMLRHKAVIQGIRYAFGFSGIMDPDEAERMEARDEQPPATREALVLPGLSEDEFAVQLRAWQPVIASGKKTSAQVVHMASTRWQLTIDQVETIGLLVPGRVAPDGEIIDASWERGDAYEDEEIDLAAERGGDA